jgi:hypothetical protein
MGEASLRARLGEVADLAGDGFEPPSPAVFTARRRARYRTVGAVTATVTTVVAVALTATLVGGSRSPSLPTPHASPPPGHVTVAKLETYHWDALPDAPIPVRNDGVVSVWTGSRMIVWGGASSRGPVYADGASYDPVTRTWQRLPDSPLGPRTHSAYAWTGDKLFIWGGRARTDATAASSGATYDPATGSWHRLPALTVGDQAFAVAVWTGDRVVLLTAPQSQHLTTVNVHAYDPATDSWSTLASIHITQTDLLDLSALVAGDQLYVWMPVQTIANGGLTTGNDGFVYRPASDSWTPTTLLPTQDPYSVGAAFWTGDHVVFEPNGLECTCGGIPGESTGSWADPRTGAVEAMPAWLPQPAAISSTFSWTGAAVLAIAGTRTAAWNPATYQWTKLAGPPQQGWAVRIWTGTQLLVWGQLSGGLPPRDPNAASPPHMNEPTGLEFKP